MLVIPNLMGIALYSPRLDEIGNSVRGLQFCQVGFFCIKDSSKIIKNVIKFFFDISLHINNLCLLKVRDKIHILEEKIIIFSCVYCIKNV